MALTAHRYERRGLLAIKPSALFGMFLHDDVEREPYTEQDGCAVVTISGPLETKHHYWCDSYEAISERVAAACQSAARAVVLRIDSPGGEVAGCFETAAHLRELCDAAGKTLHAWVDRECASAAYAIASQCHSITLGATSLVGSIGVLSTRDDVTEMNAQRGIRVALVMSGARKADGHPEAPITDAELASMQGIVDSLGGMFCELVARGRGLSADAVAQMQARVFHGAQAVAAGLADNVGTFALTLAAAGQGEDMSKSLTAKKMSYEEMRAAIAEAAEGDDPNAAAMKRALAAMDAAAGTDGGDDPPTDPPADDPPAKDDSAASSVAAMRIALEAKRDAAKLRAELAKRDEAVERAKLLASRPDITPDTLALLERVPMELVREHIAAMPALAPTGGTSRVARAGAPTLGKGQADGSRGQLPPDEKRALDARMGLAACKPERIETEHKLTLGAYRAG